MNILLFLPKIILCVFLHSVLERSILAAVIDGKGELLLPRLSPFTPRAFYGIVLRLTKVSQIMHNISYRYRANTPSSLGCIIKNDLHKFLAGPVHFTVGFTVALKCNPGISAVSLRSCEHCKKKIKNVESFY